MSKSGLISAWIGLTLLMTGCAEQKIRGVPEQKWKELNSEQRQLIIDKAYHEEIG